MFSWAISSFQFSAKAGSALRAGGWNLAEKFSLFESSWDFTSKEVDEIFWELFFVA
jgi:hypothetical protein